MDSTEAQFASPQDREIAHLQAGKVFLPNTPINTRDLFAGRQHQITMVLDSINQPGLHAVIFGERGVGKTSLANVIEPLLSVLAGSGAPSPIVVKVNSHAADTFSGAWIRAFAEVALPLRRIGTFKPEIGGQTSLANAAFPHGRIGIDDVRRTLTDLGECVFIFDEFDRMPYEESKSFTDLIKTLSDFTIPATIVLVGVSGTISELVADHQSIPRAITQVPIPRMNCDELRAILSKGETSLGMEFAADAADFIIRLSQGLPHYTHLVGLHAVRAACSRWSRRILRQDVTTSLQAVIERGYQNIIEKYTLATRSAHQDAIYAEVLLACAITASRSIDALGYFQPVSIVEPLQAILPEKEVQISTFSNHLGDFCEEKRGPVLERTGQKRNYRYRFKDPLLPPFVIIMGVSSGKIAPERVIELVQTAKADVFSPTGQMRLF